MGGTDSQHLPGDTGIFITKIKPEGSAQHDGRLREGDRIVSVKYLHEFLEHGAKSQNTIFR